VRSILVSSSKPSTHAPPWDRGLPTREEGEDEDEDEGEDEVVGLPSETAEDSSMPVSEASGLASGEVTGSLSKFAGKKSPEANKINTIMIAFRFHIDSNPSVINFNLEKYMLVLKFYQED
jgi:hypothetical protein